MSEIDALKESLSYAFWDRAAYVALFAVFLGVVGESIDQFTSWLEGTPKAATWKKASALLLIAGLAGEIATTAKNEANNGTIISFLNKEAADALKQAGDARERAAHLEALTDLQTLQMIDLEAQFGIRVPKVEQDLSKLQSQVTGSIERPLSVDEGDLRLAMRKIPRSLRTVTIMRLTDPIAGPSADNIAAALRSLKPLFKVSIVKLAASEFRGVIVCENGAGDVKVGKALKSAAIVSEIKHMSTAPECKQIGQATYADGGRGYVFGADPETDGTLIFVGHPRLPPQ